MIEYLTQMEALENLAKEFKIEGLQERMYQAISNYQIANWRERNTMNLIKDSIKYGVEQGELYLQMIAINQQKSDYNGQ